MAARGIGPFDSDEAMDFLEELDVAPLDRLHEALVEVAKSSDVDVESASRSVAAAALVALLRGATLQRVHPDAQAWVEDHLEDLDPPADDLDLALVAMERIRLQGDLWDMWEDRGRADDFEDMIRSVEDALAA